MVNFFRKALEVLSGFGSIVDRKKQVEEEHSHREYVGRGQDGDPLYLVMISWQLGRSEIVVQFP